ncbi:hypothetical protein MVEN_00159000 [Mycena venus]|uniref:Uncharacterized protein n=1 Tax=Mycena venus TaxID=2733690 RepID=A0A8H6YWH1_9AGAR|nr:hypothetical protein MVEN_00159000 [Mycena venus]
MAAPPVAFLIVLIVSSWANVSLYTLEIVLCIRYFMRPSRPLAHRIAVGVMLLADSVCTISTSTDVCLAVTRTPQTSINVRLIFGPMVVTIFATAMSSVVAQLFLCNLLHALIRNGPVTGALVLMIFVHLGLSWASGILSLQHGGGVDDLVSATTTAGAALCAATDVIIAASLAWKFWRMMRQSSPERETRSLLRRISILFARSLFRAITLAGLILHIAFFFFFTWQGRVYALTILGNFLVGIPKPCRSEVPATRGNFSAVVFRVPDDALPPKPPKAIQDGGRLSMGDLALYENHVQASFHLEGLPLGRLNGESDEDRDRD